MAEMIIVNEQNQSFHLTNGDVSYLFRVMEETKVLEHLYYGKAIQTLGSLDYLIEREVRPSNNLYEGNHTTSLEHVKQEAPVYGTTDFRYPAVELAYPDGDHISHFEYSSYHIEKGKQTIKGLPMTYAKAEEAETLILRLKDRYSDLELELYYTIFKAFPVITRRSKLINKGQDTIAIKRLMSMSLDFADNQYDFIHLHGAWAREAHLERKPLIRGVQQIGSTRGASSHVHNPFMALARPHTTESMGEAFGFQLVYSGNFMGQLEMDSYDVTRVMLGINPYQFTWQLMADETFETPEAVMVYSQEGLSDMSQTFHQFYKDHLINPKWAHQSRPILINNWEATYFNFTEEKIMTIVDEAKALGLDLFVLDDGWFGQRNDDSTSLGNWTVDANKLPNGIEGLIQKVHDKGLKFGLWFEPEMLSKGTPLFEEHPDWILGHPNKNISHGRNQFVLDFSRPEVVEAIYQQMDAILDGNAIDYVKWDMNRYISEAYSTALAANQQGEVFHRYILGVYDLYERLLAKYPDLLIESCAGGGGRFDPALLYYAPQTWTSDDTDAVERLKIQYGTSMTYPLSAIGAHVSAVPNHQVGRMTPLKMRGDVAMFGTFGYELDPTQLTDEEKEEIKKQVAFVKAHQDLIFDGDFHRILSPFEGNETAWMVVSKDKKEAIVGYYRVLAGPNPPYKRLPLRGLDKDTLYKVNEEETNRFGDDLMNIGLLFGGNYINRAGEYWGREKEGDYFSKIYVLKAVN